MTRVATLAARAADRRREAVAERLRAALPGRSVRIEGEAVVIAGRGVLDDPRLRWIGSLVR